MLDYHVLVVDDIEKNLQLIGSLLQDKGIAISFATNGAQAIKAAHKKLPDLILLDIMMPEMDGFEVCSTLAMDIKTKDIPIIFLTAKNETDDVVKGFALGAVDYVTKPFKKEELISRVFTHLELKRSKDIINKQKEQLELKNTSILEHARNVDELNNKLKHQNIELQELINTKNKLFSIISHDLKGPMQNIISFSDLILTTSEDFTQEKLIQIIRSMKQTTESSYKLLENLLEWARSQTGAIKCKPVKLDILFMLNDVLAPLQKMADNKSITIEKTDLNEKYIFADESMVNTVLRNILNNAIKFTPKNGHINIGCNENTQKGPSMLDIEVKDTGIGMSSDQIDKLFSIDKNKSSRGTDGEKGTGLGLVLCKEFTEMNNGAIKVKSEQGKGSTIICSFPLWTN